MDPDTCTCGYTEDEHGHDPSHPELTRCNVEGCDCQAFESSGDPKLVIE